MIRLAGIIFLLLFYTEGSAQKPLRNYAIRNGRMYIEIGKEISEVALDSFIVKFNLADIGLKQLVKRNNADSIIKSGWKVEVNNEAGVRVSKELSAIEPEDVSGKLSFAQLFPVVNLGIRYGYNRFRKDLPFAVHNSVVRFFLRNNEKSNKVMLAGSFNDWSPTALKMTKTDSGWIADVQLEPGKYWYKFVRDGQWMVDPENQLRENDGLGNINSVFFRPNVDFNLQGFANAKRVFVSGSFNEWREKELLMQKTSTGWYLPLYLAEGTHTYKFIIDGKWYTDEKNPDRLPDGHGGYNSVIKLGKPYVFRLNNFTNASRVLLSGSFNAWKEDELLMKKTSSGWELPYHLSPGNYEYKFIVDGKSINDPANASSGISRNSFLVIGGNYTFRLKGFENARSVYLAGDFNGWSPDGYAMKKENGEWQFKVHLSPGKHLYKFIVDGQWIIDPNNKLWEQNEHGTGNSVLWFDPFK